MMKKIILPMLFIVILSIYVSSAEAAIGSGAWLDNQGSVITDDWITIQNGSTLSFEWTVFSVNPPTDYSITLLDDQQTILTTYENDTNHGNDDGATYITGNQIIRASEYATTGIYQVRIYAEDEFSGNGEYLTFTVEEELNTCIDSDGGIDYYTYGEIDGDLLIPDSPNYDLCAGDSVREMFCNEDNLGAPTLYSCPFGCSDGACLTEEPVPPIVNITQPGDGDGFSIDNPIQFIALGWDDNAADVLTYEWDFGDQTIGNERVMYHSYTQPGTYQITVTAFDGTFNSSDAITINVFVRNYNISNLISYNDNQFSVLDSEFFRGEALYIHFNVESLITGLPSASQLNSVKIYNNETGLGETNLLPYNGSVVGTQIVNGEPATPDGNYYYYLPTLPLSDELLGTSMVFVFTFQQNSSDHAYLEITVLNNELMLSDIPNIQLSQNSTDSSIDLDDYVFDLETPDQEIVWTYQGNDSIDITINAQNIVTFTSSTWVGLETITFTADDTDGDSASDQMIVNVTSSIITNNSPPTWATWINDTTLPEDFGSVTHVVDLSTLVSDLNNDNLTFSIVDEHTLEVNCEINGNELILNSVNDWNGLATCIVRVDDGNGGTADDFFAIDVTPANDPPVLQAIPDLSISDGNTLNYQVVCSDTDGDLLSYADNTALFDISQTGAFSFTPVPSQIGSYGITITCSDGSTPVSDGFILNVNLAPRAPAILAEDLVAYVGRPFTYQVQASDQNNDALTFSDDSGLFNIDSATGIISFIPVRSQMGSHVFTVTVSDGSLSALGNFNIRILYFDPSDCSDGLDNDNDGLTDYPADPGCESSNDQDEFSIAHDFEDGVKISKPTVYGYDYGVVVRGDYAFISAVIRNENDDDLDDLTFGVIIPELGIKERLMVVDVDDDDRKSVKGFLYIPNDIEPDDYYFGLYILNGDVKKTEYVSVRVI